MMNATNSIYGARSAEMESVMHALADCIRSAAAEIKEKTGMNPVEHRGKHLCRTKRRHPRRVARRQNLVHLRAVLKT